MANLNDKIRDVVRASLSENGWVIGSLRLAMSKQAKEEIEHFYHVNSQALFDKSMDDLVTHQLHPKFPPKVPSFTPKPISTIWGIPVYVDESLKGDEFKIVSRESGE